mgnify:FL=1
MPHHQIFNERPESQDRALKELQAMGYQYIPRAEAEQKRGHLSHVLFPDVMREFLASQSFIYRGKQTPFPDDAIGEAIRELDAPLERGLMFSSKAIYDRLIYGKSCDVHLYDGNTQSFDISYINWDEPDKNIWQVTDEFSVERNNGKYARPDIVLLVNGIPLVVIECKKSSVDVEEGVKQNVRNWQPDYIPQLFKFTQLAIAMNPEFVKYGTAGTKQEFYCKWHEEDVQWQTDTAKRYVDDSHITEQDRAIVSMLSKRRLLDIIRFYILYDSGIKKVARYQQFFGVENTMRRIHGEDDCLSRGGVIWHTQGSGKSLTMVMLVKRIIADKRVANPRFVLVCDRLNLIKQLRDNFVHTGMDPVEATTGRGLVSLLKDDGNTIIATTINKFEAAAKSRTKILNENIFLLIDESHRSHTGEFHNMMNEVLPNAFKVGFTGTPLLRKDKSNTYLKFGKQIGHSYRFEDGIRDGVIVPLVYDGRVIPQKVTSDKIDDYLKSILAPLTEPQKEDMRRKWSSFMHLAQTEQRLSMIAFDIHEHFLNYCKPRGFKAMAAVSTRALAVQLEHAINGLGGVKAAALICDDSVSSEGDEGTVTKNDKAIIRDFFKNEVEPRFGTKYDDYEEYVKNNIIGGEDVDIVIVQSMLLTGFDAPSLGVLYVDKPMKEHSLLQAIARVNRIAAGKDFGLIVDYWGLFGNLNNAMEMYSDDQSGLSGYDPADIAESIVTAAEGQEKLKEAHKALWNFFGDVTFDQNNPRAWVAFFEKEDAAESEKLRKEFYEKLAAFSKMMTMAVGNYSLYQSIGFDQMQNYKADLLFFQKLRSALMMVYAEKVDFSKYEDGIRSLLNTFVTSEPVEIVVEPVAIHDKAAMDKQLEEVEGQKAKAAYIHTRIVSELESRRYEDPMLFKRFSERIRETIAEYRRSRDENIYLASMKRMAEDLRQGFTGHSYPTAISNDSDAKAFYGVVSDILKQHGQDSLEFDDAIGKLALDMKQAVQSLARVDWRTSTPIHKKMNQAVEDLLWDFCDEFGVDLPIDKMDILIENAIKTAMSRY